MTDQELWRGVLNDIQTQVSPANFTTWFKNTYIGSRKNGSVSVVVPNRFTREWLQEKYTKTILGSLRNASSDIKEVKYIIENKKIASSMLRRKEEQERFGISKESKKDRKLPFEDMPSVNQTTNLNQKYSFDSFIVGPSNELAHAAALSIIKQPGILYNPLFIYGGVGLGKTHLLQSIGNELSPKKEVIYLTFEQFTDDFISSLQNKSTESFKNKYRTKDVLIIDDVQFLTGKEQTQEEFFHTFNSLYSQNKQIVLSSDRPPRSISSLEDRLVSRFEGGMLVDIINPDYETRLAILKEKVKNKDVDLNQDILEYIANNIQNNVRELEGALNLIVASSGQLYGGNITEKQVKETLFHITNQPKKTITYKHIVKTVSRFYDIDEDEVFQKNRKQNIVVPRQIIMYLMRDNLKLSYPYIGSKIGGRDHTTAIHACEKITARIKDNIEFEDQINLIKKMLYD